MAEGLDDDGSSMSHVDEVDDEIDDDDEEGWRPSNFSFVFPESTDPDDTLSYGSIQPGGSASDMTRTWSKHVEMAIASAVNYVDAVCDIDSRCLAALFPVCTSFWWTHSRLPPVFVRQLCDAFAPRLIDLNLQNCGLRTLPREMGKLVNLYELNVAANDIRWVSASLGRNLKKLSVLCLEGNRNLPYGGIQPQPISGKVAVKLLLEGFGAVDTRFRTHTFTFMGVLRKRMRLARDVVQLLGMSLWELRLEAQ
jgi:hypothetical protein